MYGTKAVVCSLLCLSLGLPALAQSFTDVTADVGLTGTPAFRVSVGDLNGDGYPDLIVHREPTHASSDVLDKQDLFLNEVGTNPGDPFSRQFVDHTAGSGLRDNRAGDGTGRHSDAAIFGDVDNDGDLDVFTSVYLHRNYGLALGTNELLINDGNANFTLSANSTFHTEPNWNTPAATFVDYDNDGKLDLYIGTWYNPDSTMNLDHLYQGGGDGSFTDVTSAAGLNAETTCVYAVAAFDWDDDGDTDLFAPPYSRTVFWSLPRHWRNNGDGTFTQVQDTTQYDDYRGILGQKVSFGTMPRDYDNDGDVDFFEIMTHGVGDGGTGGDVHSTVVTNNGGVFSWDFSRFSGRGAEDTDLTHHGDHFASWFDYDGDMLVDLILTESGYNNPGLYLFKQASDNTFSPVTVGSGLDDINTAGLSPGYVTPFDFDRDGDEDLMITAGGELRVYRNDVGTSNNWLAIDLVGGGGPGEANVSAIGAKVSVTAGGVTQTQTVSAGDGHEGPMRPLTLHFGLGSAALVDSIDVRWPNAALDVTQLTAVAPNQFLTISEVECLGPDDPTGLLVDKDPSDVILDWDPGVAGLTWSVYRELAPDPSAWSDPPIAAGLSTSDHRDSGAGADTQTYFYLVTATNTCAESPLR